MRYATMVWRCRLAMLLTTLCMANQGCSHRPASVATAINPSGDRYLVYKQTAEQAQSSDAKADANAAAPAADGEIDDAARREGPGRGKKPADPIKTNGEIFVDWPKPQLALVFTGELDGYIEPCGCAGLENQLGGLKRRHTMLKQLAGQGWPIVAMDVGGLSKRVGTQAEIKLRYAVESLAKLGYDAVGLGNNDLKLTEGLAYVLANFSEEENPIVSANVGIFSMDSGMTKPHVVVERAGKRIGITAVLAASHIAELKNNSDLVLEDPAAALAKVAPALTAEKCDLQILMVYGDTKEASELSQRFPQFQIVLAAGGAEVPPQRPGQVPGSGAALLEPGHKGMYAIVLGMFDDLQRPFRYQRVPLDSRFPDSPEMQAALTAYQKELETMTLAGLGLTGSPHPDGEFVGSETCSACHTEAWSVFENTPHSHATDTLVKLDPPRHFDPECLSCHVVGWHPQKYFPYSSGYMGLTETPEMHHNGCENCHGPGAAHVAAESGEVEATEEEMEALRAGMRMKIVENEGNQEGQVFGAVVKNCMECHDLDNSPDFDFQKYWPYVKHEGKF